MLSDYDWAKIRMLIKDKSLKAFKQIVNSPSSTVVKDKPGSLFFPIFEHEVKVLRKARPISSVTKELLEHLLSNGENRITYLRKMGVNGVLFIKDLTRQLPPNITKKLTIIAEQEGYVFAEKEEGNRIILHEKSQDFYPFEEERGSSIIYDNEFELNNAYPELKEYMAKLQKEGLNSIVHGQLKRLSPYPFMLLEAKAILLLESFFEEEAKSEGSLCKTCSMLKDFEKCVDRASFHNFTGVKNCNYQQSLLCLISILQAYRAYIGHVKSKLEAYEQFNDYSWDYVELALTYYSLESIFQFACAHLPASSGYKGKLIDKLVMYFEKLKEITLRLENGEPEENLGIYAIEPETLKEFLPVILKLVSLIKMLLQLSFASTSPPKTFLKLLRGILIKLHGCDSEYIHVYSRLLQKILNKCGELPAQDISVRVTLTDETPEDFATKTMRDECLLRYYVEKIVDSCHSIEIDAIASPEARGYIIGSRVADKLHKPFIQIRKAKESTSGSTFVGPYFYGKVKFTIEEPVIQKYKRILIVDDDLISGGTCLILIGALSSLGVNVVGVTVLIEWPQFGGRQKIKGYKIYSAVEAYNPFLEAEKI